MDTPPITCDRLVAEKKAVKLISGIERSATSCILNMGQLVGRAGP